MCATCGCGIPEARHGDDRNLTWSEVQAAADPNDLSAEEAIENMKDMASQQASG